MNEVSLDQLSAGRFTELVRTRFNVSAEPGVGIILELVAVNFPRPGGTESVSAESQGMESFSLLFDGPADKPLRQQTYHFSHGQIGCFDLFIVPIGAEHDARQYEAVFNRRPSSGTRA